jgi:LysM domain
MNSSRFRALCGVAFWLLGGLALAGFVLAEPAWAQPSAKPAEVDRPIGWYTVRPGDTLRSLSQRLSGQEGLWEANWRLNPSLASPHLLTPGERLRLYLGTVPETSEVARITVVQRQVDQRPEPNPWGPAFVDELLQDRDAVRTRERSSTALRFGDGTVLAVSPESLVYLRRSAKRLEGVTRREIEIVAGQGELEGEPKAGRGGDIDLVLGQARAMPQAAEPGGPVRTRARRPASGGAQVMMYEGRGKVSASGATVEVDRGMGTNVPEGQPPSPPEALLPGPQIVSPSPGTTLPFANPRFTWDPVRGAGSYVFELCADAACAATVERVPGLTGTQWQPK